MKIWHLALALTAVFVTYIRGEEITIRTPRVTHNYQGTCVFPDFLTIDLLRPGQDDEWTIQLKQDNVVSKVRSVYLMADTESRDVEEFRIINDGHEGIQGYHNHRNGAAFTVKCTRSHKGRQLFLLEGSVFLNQQKYRVTPSSSWQQQAAPFASYTINVYTMETIIDFKAGNTVAKLPLSEDYAQNIAQNQATNHRYRRDVTTPVTYNIDVLTVIDYTLYNRFYNSSNGNATKTASAIMDYLASLFTAVSMRVETLSLQNRTLKIRLIQPFLMTNASQAPYTSSALTLDQGIYKLNASLLLSLFKTWLTKTKNLAAYDHAMFITAVDIYGGGDSGIKFNITKGLAYVSSVCHGNGGSSSIIEDKGAYQSEGVVAHELAHSFGSHHDGENNNCNSADRYIMSDSSYQETQANIYNPWKFSACSSESILNNLKTLEQNSTLLQQCLLKTSGSIEIEYHTVSPDEQCKKFYGNASFVCRGEGWPSLDRLCDEFYCSKPGTELCERMVAATGTCCGYQKKCLRGQCIVAAQGECPQNDNCPLGDQPGIIFEGKTCAQLDSIYCYSNNFYLKCCSTCIKQWGDQTGCTFGDKQLGCNAADCGSYFSTGTYADLPYSFICCKTCLGIIPCVVDVNLLTVQEGNGTVVYTCHDYIVDRGNRHTCYQKSVLDSCCKSCEDARNALNPGCPWGDREICTSLLNKPIGYTCPSSQLQDCCYTCEIIQPQTTTKPTTKPAMKPTTTKPTTKKSPTTTRTNSTKSSTTTTTKRPVNTTTCKSSDLKHCSSACMNIIGVQVLCILLVVHTFLVNS